MTTQTLNTEQWNEVIDRAARFYLGMSGAEFVERYNAGYFERDGVETDGLMAVVALLPPESNER